MLGTIARAVFDEGLTTKLPRLAPKFRTYAGDS